MRNGMSLIEKPVPGAYSLESDQIPPNGVHNFRGCGRRKFKYITKGMKTGGKVAGVVLECPMTKGIEDYFTVEQEVGSNPDPELIRNSLENRLENDAARLLCGNCVYAAMVEQEVNVGLPTVRVDGVGDENLLA